MSAMRSSSSGELHELGLLAAARAIRNGEVSSEVYVGKLLERASGHADFNAFITIDEASVLEAARQADRSLRAGRSAPLLGVRLAVKDSYLTNELTTTFGTSVLANFKPTRDAVARVKDAGAMVDCFRAGRCAALSDHSVCSAPDGESVEVPGGRQRRHGHLPVPEHASIELRRRARDQPSDGTELGRASTRPRARCGRRS
jgi:hypothetical protein